MISTSFRVALSAFLFAGALGLASTGPVQAQSIMKQCGDEWKAAKENNTTNGMKWPEFLKQCRVQKEGAAAPAAAPVACSCAGSRSVSRRPRCKPTSRSQSPCKPLARPAPANSLRRRSQGALPGDTVVWVNTKGKSHTYHYSGSPLVRHDEAGRLYVRGRRWSRRLSRVEEQDGTAEADVVEHQGGEPRGTWRAVSRRAVRRALATRCAGATLVSDDWPISRRARSAGANPGPARCRPIG